MEKEANFAGLGDEESRENSYSLPMKREKRLKASVQ